jgi:hypothetical protein
MSSFASLLAGYATVNRTSSAGASGTNRNDRESEESASKRRKYDFGPYYDKIATKLSQSSVPADDTTSMVPFGGLGILMIIVDSLPYEEVWKEWLDRSTTGTVGEEQDAPLPPVQMWIHAKHPDRVSPWVRERLVRFQLRPNWGSIELTEVMIRMLVGSINFHQHNYN